MSDQGASGKICTQCHLDCSTRPRVKDRAGRYICRDCLKQMKATGQPPAPHASRAMAAAATGQDHDIMAALVDEAVTRQPESCPQCGVPNNRGAVLCLHCGYNRETGKSVHTRVEKAKKEKEPKESREGRSFHLEISGTVMFFGLVGILGLLLFGGMVEPALALVYFVFLGVLALVGFIYLIIAAFADGDAIYGILALCSIVVPILGFSSLYYTFVVSERGGLKAIHGAYLIGLIGIFPLIGALSAAAPATP